MAKSAGLFAGELRLLLVLLWLWAGKSVRWMASSLQGGKFDWEGLGEPQADSLIFLPLCFFPYTYTLSTIPTGKSHESLNSASTGTYRRVLLDTPSHCPTPTKEFFLYILSLIIWDCTSIIIFDWFLSLLNHTLSWLSTNFFQFF